MHVIRVQWIIRNGSESDSCSARKTWTDEDDKLGKCIGIFLTTTLCWGDCTHFHTQEASNSFGELNAHGEWRDEVNECRSTGKVEFFWNLWFWWDIRLETSTVYLRLSQIPVSSMCWCESHRIRSSHFIWMEWMSPRQKSHYPFQHGDFEYNQQSHHHSFAKINLAHLLLFFAYFLMRICKWENVSSNEVKDTLRMCPHIPVELFKSVTWRTANSRKTFAQLLSFVAIFIPFSVELKENYLCNILLFIQHYSGEIIRVESIAIDCTASRQTLHAPAHIYQIHTYIEICTWRWAIRMRCWSGERDE